MHLGARWRSCDIVSLSLPVVAQVIVRGVTSTLLSASSEEKGEGGDAVCVVMCGGCIV